MGIEVFNRYENKFLLTPENYHIVTEAISEHMSLDAFNQKHDFYTICNIYYDTNDHYLIVRSLDGPVYKEKLRLRAYGVPGREDQVYLEIKKKYKGMVNKRRTNLTLEEAYQFLETGVKPEYKPYMNKQVLNEIEFFLKRYQLKPALYLAYDRKAYFGKENKELRITFDTNIRSRRSELGLELGNQGESLLEDDSWLMEIKTCNTLPLWLTKILTDHKIYKTSFSKYGREFEKNVAQPMASRSHTFNLKGDYSPCLNPYLVQQPLQMQQSL